MASVRCCDYCGNRTTDCAWVTDAEGYQGYACVGCQRDDKLPGYPFVMLREEAAGDH